MQELWNLWLKKEWLMAKWRHLSSFSHENMFPKFLTLINYIFPSLFQLSNEKYLSMRQETRHYVPVWRLGKHSWGVHFFFCWGGMGKGIFVFSIVLNVFSSCSHGVSKRFPKMFPIAPQIYPLWFAQSSTIMWIN